jgi:hypothetical protein
MDDQSFDELIKRKLRNYRDPDSEDPDFARLGDRLRASQTTRSGYFRYTSYVGIALAVLLTGVNAIITFYRPTNTSDTSMSKKVDSLMAVINSLRHADSARTLVLGSSSNPASVHSHKRKSADISLISTSIARPHFNPREVDVSTSRRALDNLRVKISLPQPGFVMPNWVHSAASHRKSPAISAKTMSKLERHYFSGVGINVGPQLAFSVIRHGSGTSVMPSTGISADWIISPHLSIETSLQYAIANLSVPIDRPEIQNCKDNSYGNLESAKQVENLFRTTALLKYRQWLNNRDQLVLRLGFSQYTSVAGRYNLKYSRISYPDPDDRRLMIQVNKIEGVRSFASQPEIGVGLTRQFSKNRKLEIAAFYQPALRFNNNGFQIFGIQSSYWFNVR